LINFSVIIWGSEPILYRIIIVDDEILARVGIKSLISWHEHGFELIGECENGKKAYDMAKELVLDIIITDIKMPVMNGIDLIRALKNDGMDTKFVVLSSYDDFEYVKEAMKLGAEDYILKLQMEPEELLKVLKNVCKKIEQERSEKKRSIYIEKQMNDNIPVLKEKLLKDLIFGTEVNEHDLGERFKVFGINIPQENLMCLVIHIENMELYENYAKDDIYMLKFSVISILEEIMLNYGGGYACYTEPYLFTVIWSAGNESNASLLYKSVNRMTKDMQEFLKDSMNLTVSIGVSNVHHNYSDIRWAYKEALEAISKSFTYPTASIIMYSDIKSKVSGSAGISLEMELKELEDSLKACNFHGIQKAFDKLKQKIIESNNISKKFLNGICHVLIFIINVFIQDNNIPSSEIWGKDGSPHNQVEQLKVLNDFIDWITKTCNNIITILDQDKDNKVIILKAKQFINKHFCEDISLETVAEHLGLSPGYFSRLFSKETGQSFIDFVIGLRVDYAKELLKSTKYKVYEVSEMVGYDNPHYFSRIFKKVAGVSPIEYKDHLVS